MSGKISFRETGRWGAATKTVAARRPHHNKVAVADFDHRPEPDRAFVRGLRHYAPGRRWLEHVSFVGKE